MTFEIDANDFENDELDNQNWQKSVEKDNGLDEPTKCKAYYSCNKFK